MSEMSGRNRAERMGGNIGASGEARMPTPADVGRETPTRPSGQRERAVGEEEMRGRHQFKEGRVATALEHRTAQLPSDMFLWAAGASITGSLILQMFGRKNDALFVGQWAPTFLCLGIYNKIVKTTGHDAMR